MKNILKSCGTVYDENQKPLSGISVTDGIHVCVTDENGKFSLPGWEKSSFVTVTVPSGYTCAHFYIPVSEDRDSYDFRIEKIADEDLYGRIQKNDYCFSRYPIPR